MRETASHSSCIRRLRCVMATLLCVAILFPASARGQEEDVKRRVNEIEKRIAEMMAKAEDLQAAGRAEEAEQLLDRANATRAELEAWLRQLEGQARERETKERPGQHYLRALEHLEHSMNILNEHGNTELAAQLERVADQIRERIERRPREENPERQMARRQIEVIRLALPVLREAERRDAVELAELAIRARELGLEGVRGEEANAIRERAPRGEGLREILGMAIELYQKFKMPERAEQLATGVREVFPHREREGDRERARERERERDRPREREQSDRREGEREREGDERAAQLRRLAAHVAELEAALKEAQEAIRQLQKDDR